MGIEGTVFSLLPPLVAIVLCIILREAIPALVLGVFTGALLLNGLSFSKAFFHAADDIMLNSFINPDHAVVIMFTVLTGGITGILNGSPTARAVITQLASRLHSRVKAMMAVWITGVLFFIDDYANCLVVGNVYRGLCDRLRISREKLAFIVDTTAAPVTSLALVSTWIGVEISLINDSLQAQGATHYTGYSLFLSSIPFRFYPILALIICFFVCGMGRDFGPMRKIENDTFFSPPDASLEPVSGTIPPKIEGWSYFVFLPITVLLIASFLILAWHGYSRGVVIDWSSPLQTLINLFTAADPFRCLLWATMISTVVSFVVHLGLLYEPFSEVNANWFSGCQGMFTVCVILVLAWSIGDVCTRLKTGAYVASLLGQGFDPWYLPLLTYLFAALISFATGTSYGTMSILMPIALPIALKLGAGNTTILYGTVGSVLGGSIFGDHCSPLSDTTILSSGASGCTVTSHVSTQMPYAFLAGTISLLCLFLVPYPQIPAYALILTASVIMVAILYLFGHKPEKQNG